MFAEQIRKARECAARHSEKSGKPVIGHVILTVRVPLFAGDEPVVNSRGSDPFPWDNVEYGEPSADSKRGLYTIVRPATVLAVSVHPHDLEEGDAVTSGEAARTVSEQRTRHTRGGSANW